MYERYDIFKIGTHFIGWIFNADPSGLTDDEFHEVQAFVAALPRGHFDAHLITGPNVGFDDVTGLLSEIVEIAYFVEGGQS